MSKKLFDFAIGNPPFQGYNQRTPAEDDSKKNYAPPVYNLFIDEAYRVADVVELIHPARFLFNAGSTPRAWNEKMLGDEHLKVLSFEPDSKKVFPNLTTPLKGGVAITYRDESQNFGAIHAFTQFQEANSVSHKVTSRPDFKSLADIVYSRTAYRMTELVHKDHPEYRYKEDENGNNLGRLSKGHDYDMSSNIFGLLPEIFYDKAPNDGDYVKIHGRDGSQRISKFIRRDYIKDVENLEYYKVLVPQATGNGAFGETVGTPIIGTPNTGNTETFISIGKFESRAEAEAAKKYICTKFARTLLSILKVTQNGNKPVWRLIPLQNFSGGSDIDWSKSIAAIDRQFYAKYGLTTDEINFIESHVKEMS